MQRTFIGELRSHIGEKVQIHGFLQTLRDQKKMQFLIIRDQTGLVQVAFWKANDAALAEQISTLGAESVVTITGAVVDNPVVKLGGLEVQLESLRVDSTADSPLPLDPFAETIPSIDYRLDQVNLLENRRRAQLESWVEWTPTWGFSFRIPELEFRYRGRVTNGTGRPGVENVFPTFERAGTPGMTVIAAPSGPMTLQEVKVVTHQISVTLPLARGAR